MSDEFQITNGPDQKYYKKYNKNIFFSYPSSSTSFQSGYLGIGPSKISGFLHIRSP
ncbi:6640_t:CDS:1, partial [Acaulospora morrowiae]